MLFLKMSFDVLPLSLASLLVSYYYLPIVLQEAARTGAYSTATQLRAEYHSGLI
jgi:hypothetical protein